MNPAYSYFHSDGTAKDIGWISFCTDHGQNWSAPIQDPADRLDVRHITEAVGGPVGIAYVGRLSHSDPRGYAQYLRTFATTRGWLSPPLRVSSEFGDPSVWPGDAFGISSLSPTEVVSGSATVHAERSQTFSAQLSQCSCGD